MLIGRSTMTAPVQCMQVDPNGPHGVDEAITGRGPGCMLCCKDATSVPWFIFADHGATPDRSRPRSSFPFLPGSKPNWSSRDPDEPSGFPDGPLLVHCLGRLTATCLSVAGLRNGGLVSHSLSWEASLTSFSMALVNCMYVDCVGIAEGIWQALQGRTRLQLPASPWFGPWL